MIRLQDASSFMKAQSYTNVVLETAWLIRPEYIRAQGWSAILLPGSVSDQEEEPTPSLLSAMDTYEPNGYFAFHTEGLMLPEAALDGFTAAVGTRNMEQVDWFKQEIVLREYQGMVEWCYSLSPSKAEVISFWEEHKILYNLVVPDSETFMVMNCSFDYHIITGPKQFVETALGEPLTAAREKVKTPGAFWIPDEERAYLGYAARYEALDILEEL